MLPWQPVTPGSVTNMLCFQAGAQTGDSRWLQGIGGVRGNSSTNISQQNKLGSWQISHPHAVKGFYRQCNKGISGADLQEDGKVALGLFTRKLLAQ